MAEGAILYGIPKDQVPDVWSLALPWIEKGLIPGDCPESLVEIYTQLLTREKQLWLFVREGEVKGSGLSELAKEEGSGLTVCWIYALSAQDFSQDRDVLFRQFELWVRAVGGHLIRVRGRKGWQKIFPDWQTRETDDGILFLEKVL